MSCNSIPINCVVVIHFIKANLYVWKDAVVISLSFVAVALHRISIFKQFSNPFPVLIQNVKRINVSLRDKIEIEGSGAVLFSQFLEVRFSPYSGLSCRCRIGSNLWGTILFFELGPCFLQLSLTSRHPLKVMNPTKNYKIPIKMLNHSKYPNPHFNYPRYL